MRRGVVIISSGPVMLLVCILCCSISCQNEIPAQNDNNLAEATRPSAPGTRPAAQTEANRDEPSKNSISNVRSGPTVAEFYRLANAQDSSDGVGYSARLFVTELPPEEQLRVARSLVNDPDSHMKMYGVFLLVELGYEDEAVGGFAELVVAGQDTTALGWAWAHARDDLVGGRMYVKASYHLLGQLDGLTGSEREQAERFLCDAGLVNPIAEFSRDAVLQRLRNLEERLKLAELEQD